MLWQQTQWTQQKLSLGHRSDFLCCWWKFFFSFLFHWPIRILFYRSLVKRISCWWKRSRNNNKIRFWSIDLCWLLCVRDGKALKIRKAYWKRFVEKLATKFQYNFVVPYPQQTKHSKIYQKYVNNIFLWFVSA